MKNGDDIDSMLACSRLTAELRLDSDSGRPDSCRRKEVLGGTVRHQEHPINLNHHELRLQNPATFPKKFMFSSGFSRISLF